MNDLKIEDIPHYSDICYKPVSDQHFHMSAGSFQELACFAIWEEGRKKEDHIIHDLSEEFEVLGNFLVYWSDEHYAANVARLYEYPYKEQPFSGYIPKIGKPPFRFVIVRDQNPSYTWKQSVSGAIEPANEAIVRKKYEYRSWFSKNYQVHSSNNLREFYHQAVLVLGLPLLKSVLAGEYAGIETEIEKDLEGAAGWADWKELFSVLNHTTNYLVLRNFESLPEKLDDADIDFLTPEFQRVASAANVVQQMNRPYKGILKVGDQNIPTDIRFVGDGYYPTIWARDLIDRKVIRNGIYAPAEDDYFFTLLYHALVHKNHIKPAYKNRLQEMATQMRFDWYTGSKSEEISHLTELLRGYMKANKYYYTNPLDRDVGASKAVVKKLPQLQKAIKTRRFSRNSLVYRLWLAAKHPSKIVNYIAKKAGYGSH